MSDPTILDLLDNATKEQLFEMARGGVGEPDPGRAVIDILDNGEE